MFEWLPSLHTSMAVNEWLPPLRLAGTVKLHVPFAATVAVPIMRTPSYTLT
ncbi:hypothetical protein SAMN05414139_02496 [Burkholderia sp. D7]|nr:hypothetical protein SAMN05414139_02496 [Burkholderia sp. D7]